MEGNLTIKNEECAFETTSNLDLTYKQLPNFGTAYFDSKLW